MHATVERLYEAMRALGIEAGQTSAARFLSLPNSQTVKNWEERGMSNAGMVAASMKGINPAWLQTGLGRALIDRHPTVPASSVDDYNASEIVGIHVSGIVHADGVGNVQVGQVGNEETVFFRAAWLEKRGLTAINFSGFTMLGRGMEPTLYEGDIVFLNHEETTPVDGEVFVVGVFFRDNKGVERVEGVVKRLMKRGGSWYMHSDNLDQNRYPPVPLDEHCFIIGRVVYRQSERI